jgi:uncharacterized protein (DUF2249 family)
VKGLGHLTPVEMAAYGLEALATLKPGEKLLVHHVRRPIHLLARLEEEGHAYALKDLGPGQVKLLIRKGG